MISLFFPGGGNACGDLQSNQFVGRRVEEQENCGFTDLC